MIFADLLLLIKERGNLNQVLQRRRLRFIGGSLNKFNWENNDNVFFETYVSGGPHFRTYNVHF